MPLDHVIEWMRLVFHQYEWRMHFPHDVRNGVTLQSLCLLIPFNKTIEHANLGCGFLLFALFALHAVILLTVLLF